MDEATQFEVTFRLSKQTSLLPTLQLTCTHHWSLSQLTKRCQSYKSTLLISIMRHKVLSAVVSVQRHNVPEANAACWAGPGRLA